MLALQSAIHGRLTGDAALMALVTGVYDAVPPGTSVPYVVIGEFTESENRAFDRGGHSLTATLHIYDQDGVAFSGVAARGAKRSFNVLSEVIAALETLPITAVAGHALIECTYEFGTPLKEDDAAGGFYRHIPARFRILLEDTPP